MIHNLKAACEDFSRSATNASRRLQGVGRPEEKARGNSVR